MISIFKDTNFNFTKHAFKAILLSIILIVIGMAHVIYKGGFRYGVDFSGGIVIQVRVFNPVSFGELRKKVEEVSRTSVNVQNFEAPSSEFLIRILKTEENPSLLSDRIIKKLKEEYGEKIEVRRVETVGATVGKDLFQRGVLSVIFSLLGMLVYIAFRFDFVSGIGAIIALIHDVLVTLGFISLGGKEIDLLIIAALLTIVGYSINDTIVIYDRIRENVRKMKKVSFEEIVNRSINETLSRTIITSGTTIFAVLSLFLLGGGIIHDFAYVLLVGMISGTYSTIFIASPFVIFWRREK